MYYIHTPHYLCISFIQSAVPMCILRGYVAESPITDLVAAAKGQQASFNTAHLLPHGHEVTAAVDAVAQAANRRMVQSLLDEAPSKTNNVITKSICTSTIGSMGTCVGALANTTALLLTLVSFDPTSDEMENVPFLHYAARRIAVVVTSKEYIWYAKKHVCNANIHYYVFNLFNRVHATASKVLMDEGSIAAASPGNGDALKGVVNKSYLVLANASLNRGLEHIKNVCADAVIVEEVAIFTHSVFGRTASTASGTPKRHSDEAGGNAQEPKKVKKEKVAKTVNSRAINCINGQMINMPTTWPDGETPLCGGVLRNGSKGCKNPKCSRNHDKPPAWSKALIQHMKSHVKADKNLTWNPLVMTPDILGLDMNKVP